MLLSDCASLILCEMLGLITLESQAVIGWGQRNPLSSPYTHMLLLLAFSGVLGSKLRSHEGPASYLPTKPSPQPS